MDKMTKREFYTAIKNGEIDEQVKEFAAAELEKLDAANEKRRNTMSKKAQENLPLMEKIMDEILGEEPKTATDVSEVLDVSVQKASGLLRRLVKEGRAEKVDVKIKGKGTQKAYKLMSSKEEDHFEVDLDGNITHVTE